MRPAGVQFTILGPVRAWRDTTELDLGPPQQRAVLALLLARGGQPTSLGELVDMLWAADPPVSAVNIVHRYVGALRRVLEPGLPPRAVGRWLVRHGAGYRVASDAETLDLLRFRELARQARETAASRQAEQAVPLFAAALTLCQGSCAGDLTARHPAFTAVDQECLAVVREAADIALTAGLANQVLPALRQAAGRDPLAEQLQARFMLALAATGNQAGALAVYEATRARLAEHLGLDPGAELREAHGRVLRQQASGAATLAAGGKAATSDAPAGHDPRRLLATTARGPRPRPRRR